MAEKKEPTVAETVALFTILRISLLSQWLHLL
jgi:hypothetical protein